jgi:hypothetical protein
MLGIATRKAGSRIECPKCGVEQEVPNEDAALAALAMTALAKEQDAVFEAGGVVVYEDDPAIAELPGAGRTSRASTSVRRTVPPLAVAPGEPVPDEMILFPRRVYYVQGILFALLAVVAFGAGYLIGRGDANFELRAEQERLQRERMLIEGTLLYENAAGQTVGDGESVVIALRDGRLPEKTLSSHGIRPRDDVPADDHPAIKAITALGGVYARADESGHFSMVLPDYGEYHLLMISRHATRRDDDEIGEIDYAELLQYFTMPETLIEGQAYRWLAAKVDSGFDRRLDDVNFSQPGPQ